MMLRRIYNKDMLILRNRLKPVIEIIVISSSILELNSQKYNFSRSNPFIL